MARGEFASLMRSWRDRVQPAAVGLPVGQRKTAGLRREEVAMLAGLSVDYVVRLEQGRAERPSEQVVASLARVLQLSGLERDQFYLAAGLAAPLPSAVPVHVPASVQRLLARLPDVAVSVYSATWTLLTVNAAWNALLGPMSEERNLIVQVFTGTAPAVLWDEGHAEHFERALVSDLRTVSIRFPEDRSVRGLIDRLHSVSERFAQLWAEGSIVDNGAGVKSFAHPVVGDITVDCDVFTVVGTDLRIVTYTAAPGTEDASKFDLVRAMGSGNPLEAHLGT